MPKGGKRPRSGPQPKSFEQLKQSGTFRPSRHAYLLQPTFPTVVSPWEPTAADLAGLGPAATAFVTRTATDFVLTESNALSLMAGAKALDRMQTFQREIDAQGPLINGKPHPLLRALAAEGRAFSMWLNVLDLEK